ncbi:hypothetical protein AAVH_21131, partial [Aphelenchoides avenae]
ADDQKLPVQCSYRRQTVDLGATRDHHHRPEKRHGTRPLRRVRWTLRRDGVTLADIAPGGLASEGTFGQRMISTFAHQIAVGRAAQDIDGMELGSFCEKMLRLPAEDVDRALDSISLKLPPATPQLALGEAWQQARNDASSGRVRSEALLAQMIRFRKAMEAYPHVSVCFMPPPPTRTVRYGEVAPYLLKEGGGLYQIAPDGGSALQLGRYGTGTDKR